MEGSVLEVIEFGHFLVIMPCMIYRQCLGVILQRRVLVVEGHHVLQHMRALNVVLAVMDFIVTTRCIATDVVHNRKLLYYYLFKYGIVLFCDWKC